MLVSDAMPSVGSDAATFELQGRTIRREGDILRGADGVLVGSTLTMAGAVANMIAQGRSEEHTSELHSLMRISYAVFCLKKKTKCNTHLQHTTKLYSTSQ